MTLKRQNHLRKMLKSHASKTPKTVTRGLSRDVLNRLKADINSLAVAVRYLYIQTEEIKSQLNARKK